MVFKVKTVRDAWRWRRGQRRPLSRDPHLLLGRMTALGDWLEGRNYVGIDVNPDNPSKFIATVPAFASIGWLNLTDLTRNSIYRRKADACLSKILDDQQADGCWLFPYRFRKNPPDFPYACESFMTIEGLMAYATRIEKTDRLTTAIDKALQFLLTNVGYDGNAFYYSSADKIRIPNISSMAARVFAEAGMLFRRADYTELAGRFALYCVSQQEQDGSYPYTEGQREVCVPYHALETWELAEANRWLANPDVSHSLSRAIQFLDRTLQENEYATFYPLRRRGGLLKTPIWSAKAFLSMGLVEKALDHFCRGLELFGIPDAGHYFYVMQNFRGFRFPQCDTPYIRYNASAFEIGTSLLCRIQ